MLCAKFTPVFPPGIVDALPTGSLYIRKLAVCAAAGQVLELTVPGCFVNHALMRVREDIGGLARFYSHRLLFSVTLPHFGYLSQVVPRVEHELNKWRETHEPTLAESQPAHSADSQIWFECYGDIIQ